MGGHLHRLSFRSWPLLPILDRRLLHVLFNLDPEVLLKRRLEYELLRGRYPQLTTIPFDTNSFRFTASQIKLGRKKTSAAARFHNRLRYQTQRWYWQHWRRTEPRRYYRLFDLNSRYWKPVRCAAEVHRVRIHDCLDRTTFDRLLPSPDVKIRYRNPFAEGAPRRTLLGMLFWHGQQSQGLRKAS